MREAADATRSQKSAIVRMFRRSTYNNRHLRVFENADIMSDVFPIRRSPTTTVFCPVSIFDDNIDSISGRGQNTSPFTTHPYSNGFIAIFSLLRQIYQTFYSTANGKLNKYV
jgi:hypothetical protein